MLEPITCPFAAKNYEGCTLTEIYNNGDSVKHLHWHLDLEVANGNITQNADGTYNLGD